MTKLEKMVRQYAIDNVPSWLFDKTDIDFRTLKLIWRFNSSLGAIAKGKKKYKEYVWGVNCFYDINFIRLIMKKSNIKLEE